MGVKIKRQTYNVISEKRFRSKRNDETADPREIEDDAKNKVKLAN